MSNSGDIIGEELVEDEKYEDEFAVPLVRVESHELGREVLEAGWAWGKAWFVVPFTLVSAESQELGREEEDWGFVFVSGADAGADDVGGAGAGAAVPEPL